MVKIYSQFYIFNLTAKNQQDVYVILLQRIILTTCLGISHPWYFESCCEMLRVMSITAVINYILASFKLVCEFPDDGKVVC